MLFFCFIFLCLRFASVLNYDWILCEFAILRNFLALKRRISECLSKFEQIHCKIIAKADGSENVWFCKMSLVYQTFILNIEMLPTKKDDYKVSVDGVYFLRGIILCVIRTNGKCVPWVSISRQRSPRHLPFDILRLMLPIQFVVGSLPCDSLRRANLLRQAIPQS